MTPPDAKSIKKWARMGPRAMFGQFMLELAETVPNLMVIKKESGFWNQDSEGHRDARPTAGS